MKKKIMSIAIAAGVIFSGGEFAHASLGDDIINTGHKYLNTPYKFGSAFGNTRTFDCSSFTSYVFSRHGINIPRTSIGQASVGVAVSKSNLQKGDLVFYDTDFDGRINHAGIYAGNGKMLNAQSKGVSYADAFSKYYWGARYITARRVINQKAPAPKTAVATKSPTVPKTVQATTATTVKVHKVQRGETLYSISKKYKTSVAAIQKLNLLKSTSLKVGQTLKLSGTAPVVKTNTVKKASVMKAPVKKASITKASATKKIVTSTKVASSKATVYTVKRGNSLWSISRGYNVSVSQLMKSNKLKSANIYPGQKLIINH
jgi:LysM repeat protein